MNGRCATGVILASSELLAGVSPPIPNPTSIAANATRTIGPETPARIPSAQKARPIWHTRSVPKRGSCAASGNMGVSGKFDEAGSRQGP